MHARAKRVGPELDVQAWVIDHSGVPKGGTRSHGVQRQYSGTRGRTPTARYPERYLPDRGRRIRDDVRASLGAGPDQRASTPGERLTVNLPEIIHPLLRRLGLDVRIQSSLHGVGLDLRKHRPASRRRIAQITASGVRTVIDVGANVGQYGAELRRSGFDGHIVSFEPLDEAFSELRIASSGDERWLCEKLAISDRAGTARINVAANEGASSSLLAMADAHTEAMPEARIVGVEDVSLGRLDAVAALESVPNPLMLKLDVQGHEVAALEGAAGVLDRVVLIEAELSLCQLYEGAPLMPEVLTELAARGFELIALEPGFYHPRDGRFLQFDGLFLRMPPS